MAVFTRSGSGFTSYRLLMHDLIGWMTTTAGFTKIYPTVPIVTTDLKIVLESSASVDPLFSTQPWRIFIDMTPVVNTVPVGFEDDYRTPKIYFGTSAQLGNDPSSYVPFNVANPYNGSLQDHYSNVITINYNLRQAFFTKENALATTGGLESPGTDFTSRISPMSYRATVTGHGIFFAIWEDAKDSSTIYPQSWFNIQRFVNSSTGAPLLTGQSPLLCTYYNYHTTVSNKPTIRKFILREKDTVAPSDQRIASEDGEDANRLINLQKQVSVTEDNKYVITFPGNLTSTKFAYPVNELDMIGFTSADVIGHNAEVDITLYGEGSPRKYVALPALQQFGTGVRIMMQKTP